MMLTVYNYILTRLLPLYCSLYRRLHVLECDGLEMFLTLHVGDQLGVRLAGLREAPGRPALAVHAGQGRRARHGEDKLGGLFFV